MIKEVHFGSPVKIGKGLTISWYSNKGQERFKCESSDGAFLFEDSKGEHPTTVVGKENVKYFVLEKVDLETSTHLTPPEDKPRRGRKPNDKSQA